MRANTKLLPRASVLALALMAAGSDGAATTPAMQGETIALRPSGELDEARLPLACEYRLTGNPPCKPVNAVQRRLDELVRGRLRFKEDGAKLDVDEQGTAQVWKPMPADKALRIELAVDGVRWPLLFWRERDCWFVASGALLSGPLHGQVLESYDADLDGVHLGESDWLRFGDGAYFPCGTDALAHTARGLVGLKNAGDHKSVKFSCMLVPHPSGVATSTGLALAELNHWRMQAGQAPMRLNLERCLGLQKHALYVATAGNDGDLLEEVPGKPGYTVEGAEAVRTHTILAPVTDPIQAIGPTFLSAYNRANFLCDPEEGFAAASMVNRQPERHGGRPGYAWIATKRGTGLHMGVPRVCPAPGQVGVAPIATTEWPVSEDRPALFASQRGTAVAAYYGGAAWVDAQIVLVDPNGKLVKGECYTPENPAAPKKGAANQNAAFFWPAAPLRPRTRYTVEFRANDKQSGADVPVLLIWSFVTGKS